MAVAGFGVTIDAFVPLRSLTVLRLQYGIQRVTMDFDYDGERLHHVNVMLITEEFHVRGTGPSEMEAFDDAFARLVHRVGAACTGTVVAK